MYVLLHSCSLPLHIFPHTYVYGVCVCMRACMRVSIWLSPLIGISLSEPHTGGSRFNCSMVVTFPKVYATNMESPTLVVVDSTTVQWSHSQKFTLVARKDWYRTWYVHELKLHAE